MIAFLSVVLAMVVVDFVWAEYVKYTAAKQPFMASAMAVGIISGSGFVTTQYVAHPTLLIAAAIGAFAGTYLSVWRSK